MSEIIIKSEEEFNETIKNGVCLVDFFANWCGPCKLLGPFVEEIAKQYDGKAKVCKVNVDEVETLAYKYNVRSIPTLIYFKDGKIKNTSVGFQDKQTIASTLDSYL